LQLEKCLLECLTAMKNLLNKGIITIVASMTLCSVMQANCSQDSGRIAQLFVKAEEAIGIASGGDFQTRLRQNNARLATVIGQTF